MTPSDRTAAQTALSTGRATYARLDQIRGPEDTAADLIELWGAVESAMRSMLGGSSLSGQALVREVRQRGLITLDQANTLVAFVDARNRVESVNYKPTLTDVSYARAGYDALTKALEQPIGQMVADASPKVGQESNVGVSGDTYQASNSYTPSPATGYTPVAETTRSPRRWLSIPVIASVTVILVVIGVLSYFLFGRSSYERDMARAIDLMQAGQTQLARAQFMRIVSEHPDATDPHVFLSRLARNEGDLVSARRELVTVIQREPTNGLALREMGMLLLAENNPALARNFLIRAVRADPKDLAAQGYLGCALVKLNRLEEAQRFLNRAGPGNWSSCNAALSQLPAR
jgi:cytochrome c-type biogenesis protein CcmH/NrfG